MGTEEVNEVVMYEPGTEIYIYDDNGAVVDKGRVERMISGGTFIVYFSFLTHTRYMIPAESYQIDETDKIKLTKEEVEAVKDIKYSYK